MRNKNFDKLLKEAIILDAEEQGARMEPSAEPIPAEAQARFDAALNGKRKEPKKTNDNAFWEQPQPRPVKRAHRWLAYGLTAVSATAVVLVVVLLVGTGMGIRGAKATEPGEAQPMQAETTLEPLSTVEPFAPTEPEPEFQPPEPGGSEPEPTAPIEPEPGEAQPQDALIGTWTLKAMESEDESQSGQIAIVNAMIAAGQYEATYTFLSDGNGLFYCDIQGEKTAQAFTYVIDGDKLTFGGETMTFAVEGDRLSLTEEGLTLLFDRGDSGTAEGEKHSDLPLKTETWQGYTCLFPETFEIRTVESQKLSATEEALLKLDMEALQTVGLTDMDYYLVAESMLNGKDLLTWYLEADGWDDKPEDFDTAESVEIAPGIVSVHYYNRNYDSYICIAKLNTIGTNTLFLAASSMTKAGTADFDGIAKQFVTVNGDFASSDTGILNEKYGKSKVFTGDGYQITLTEQFSEQKSEMGFDGYYTSYFGAVMIKIEPFTLKAGLENETVAEYIAGVIKNNKTDAKPEEKDGLAFYRYTREGMCGWNFAFKGEKAFYLVQFLCREADAAEMEELFFSIAKTMRVEGSDKWNL